MWFPHGLETGVQFKYPGPATILVGIAIGVALLACIISQFLQLSYPWILALGVAFVFAGSAIPQVLPRYGGHRWCKWARAVSVGSAIAIGAFISTYGWNVRSSHLRDRAVLTAVAYELDLNQMYIELLSLAHQEYEVTGNLDAMTALCLPTTNHIGQVVTAWGICAKDPEFADAAFLYVVAADSLAAQLKKIDLVCSSRIVSRDMAKPIIDSAFGDKRTFKAFWDQHKRFAGQLTAKYDWCFGDAKSRMRKPVLDDFYLNVVLPKQMQLTTRDHQQRMKELIDDLKGKGRLTPIPANNKTGKAGEDPNG
jgi:hypothetical protein